MTGKIRSLRRRVLVGTGILVLLATGALVGTQVVAGAQSAAPSSVTHPPAGTTLDHFTCYFATAGKSAAGTQTFTPPGAVELLNQFVPQGVFTPIGNVAFHCNPTAKTVPGTPGTPPVTTPITNKAAHLLCFTTPPQPAAAVVPQPTYKVAMSNQFGSAILDTIHPVLLCLPTWKSLTGLPNNTQVQPPGLDHFLCYTAAYDPNSPSRFTPPPVTLQDQFMPKPVKATVVTPNLVCLPTQKILSPLVGTTAVNFNDPHLVCFSLKVGAVRAPTVFDQNQFGQGPVSIKKLTELCVPSTKKVTSAGGSVTITKTDAAGIPLMGATFTAYASADVSKTTPLGTCITGVAGVCTITGLPAPAGYIISETTPPVGYSAGPDQTVTIATSPGVAAATFVDSVPGTT